jgi:hypothetical protein
MSTDITNQIASTDTTQLPIQLLGQSDAGACCGGACCN